MHDSAQALRGKKLLLVGFTLFSMFFGAGNLIFPPFLGAQAGTALWLAFVGFAVSAHRGRGSSGPGGRSACAGRAGPSPFRTGVRCAGLSVHRSLPRDPPHGQHLV